MLMRFAIVLSLLTACGSTDTIAERAPAANTENTENTNAPPSVDSQEAAAEPPDCLTYEHVFDPGVEFGQPIEIDDTRSWPIEGVTLEVSAEAETNGIAATATLRNTTSAPQPVDYLANGPFTVHVEGAEQTAQTEPPLPSSIPVPLRMILPPGATARLVVHQCGPSSGPVRYVFSPWGSTAVQGTIHVAP